MSFAQVAKGYLSTIANKNSFSLITNMRVASVSTDIYIYIYIYIYRSKLDIRVKEYFPSRNTFRAVLLGSLV